MHIAKNSKQCNRLLLIVINQKFFIREKNILYFIYDLRNASLLNYSATNKKFVFQ